MLCFQYLYQLAKTHDAIRYRYWRFLARRLAKKFAPDGEEDVTPEWTKENN